MFAWESMFNTANNASKLALVVLVRQMSNWGFELIDSQVHTDTLGRLGAIEIERCTYLEMLPDLVNEPRMVHPWSFDADFDPSQEVGTTSHR